MHSDHESDRVVTEFCVTSPLITIHPYTVSLSDYYRIFQTGRVILTF
jgi:hypothetical protein